MSGVDGLDTGSGFPDEMVRVVFSAGARSAYNRKQSVFTEEATRTKCRIRPLTPREIAALGGNQTETATNMLHLPLNTDISSLDRLVHVAKWGKDLDRPVYYDVVGSPNVVALEITVQLKVTTNVKE